MTPEHMLARTQWYENYLNEEGICKKRMNTTQTFGDLQDIQLLAHAHYLCDNVRRFASDPAEWDKANRHYTALQMCLSFAKLFTLDELMEHNKHLPPGTLVDKKA